MKGVSFLAGLIRKKTAMLHVPLIAACLSAGCAREPDRSIVLRMAHPLDSTHPVHQAAEFMKKRLAEESGGRIRLELRPNGQLGSTIECVEQVQMGILDMTVGSAGMLEGFIPEMGLFSVPYLFRDSDHYWRVLNGPIGQKILAFGERVYLKGLCFYDAGSRSFYTKNRMVRTPDDLRGLKIRVMQSRGCMDAVKALGASPTPIFWGELYTALQQGVVDGAENNATSFYTSRHYEVCPYYSLDEHVRIPDLLLMSSARWGSLGESDRKLIQRVARESSVFQRRCWARRTEESMAALREAGVEIVIPDRAAFFEKSQAVRRHCRTTLLGELIDEVERQ